VLSRSPGPAFVGTNLGFQVHVQNRLLDLDVRSPETLSRSCNVRRKAPEYASMGEPADDTNFFSWPSPGPIVHVSWPGSQRGGHSGVQCIARRKRRTAAAIKIRWFRSFLHPTSAIRVLYSPETFEFIYSTFPHEKAKSNWRRRTPQQAAGHARRRRPVKPIDRK